MSPNERANRLMTDFMDAELHESAVAVIAKHIRAAENDALQRAADTALHLNGWGSIRAPELAEHISACIRRLKHVP